MNDAMTSARDAVEKLGLSALDAIDEEPNRLPAIARVAALIGSDELATRIVGYVDTKASAMVRSKRSPLPNVVAAFAESLAIVETVVVPVREDRRGDAAFL